MCLGVPGKVVSIEESAVDMPMGVVSFAGITKEVCFAYTPDIKVGEYVLVHVGFAISKLDEDHALEVFRTLKEMGELGDLEIPQPSGTRTP
jgi:hydrogenase expression/formation protein HypC